MTTENNISVCPYCKEQINPGALKCRFCGSSLGETQPSSPSSQRETPETWVRNALRNRYEIIKLIGKGGMASVYKARQVVLDRVVALKVIHPNLLHDQEFVDRFLQEARVCAKLSHPNVVQVLDFGEADGIYYMAMELLEGNDLSEILQRQKRLKFEIAMSYLAPVAQALTYIHQKGFMHRDVKSSNIFITSAGRPVLMDFGIAFASDSKSITMAGTLLGTPQFLSPEQAAGNKAKPQSDYYSLGVVLYECLTGRVPFHDSNPMVVIHKIINEEPLRPTSVFRDISAKASDITMGLLSKEPNKRMDALNIILKDYLESALNLQNRTFFTPVGLSQKPQYARSKTQKNNSGSGKRTLLKVLLGIVFLAIASISAYFIIVNTSSQIPLLPGADSANEKVELWEDTKPQSSDAYISEAGQVKEKLASILPDKHNPRYIIEKEMIEFKGYRVMRDFVSDRLWNLVMNDQDTGNDHAVSNFSFQQVEVFLNKLNELAIDTDYQIPSLDLVMAGYDENIFAKKRNEWVSDPPVFPTGERPHMAKYYHRAFHNEAGENRNRRRNDIYFRLVVK